MDIYRRIIDYLPIGSIAVYAQNDYIIRLAFINKDFFEKKEIIKKSRILDYAEKQLEEYFSGKRKAFDLKCELPSKGFDRLVYDNLMKIKYGETTSYKELAELCGNAGSARAIGNSLRRNPIPVIIPCHRIIKSDGTYGGYSGGADIKKYLIELEKTKKKKKNSE